MADPFAVICAHVHVSAAKDCARGLALLYEARQLIQRNLEHRSQTDLPRIIALFAEMEDLMLTTGENTNALMLENLELRRERTAAPP